MPSFATRNDIHKPQVLVGLQAGRFFAAAAVLLFHIYLEPFSHHPFGRTFDFGFLGVDFFFVLSGFIILYIHWDDIGNKGRIKGFALKRFIRIYPAYFVLMSLMTIILLVKPHIGLKIFHEPLYILQNFLLLPTENDPIIGLSWSLQHELFFYGLFAVFIVSPKFGASLLSLWFVASALVGLRVPFPLSWLCDPRHLEFLMGMLGAYLLKTTTIPYPRLVLLLGFMLLGFVVCVCDFLHVGANDQSDQIWTRTPLYLPAGLSSLVIILGLVESERQGLIHIPVIFIGLGNISYSLYLIQEFPLEIYHKNVGYLKIIQEIPSEITMMILFLVIVVIAAFFHYKIENPLINLLRKFLVNLVPRPRIRRA